MRNLHEGDWHSTRDKDLKTRLFPDIFCLAPKLLCNHFMIAMAVMATARMLIALLPLVPHTTSTGVMSPGYLRRIAIGLSEDTLCNLISAIFAGSKQFLRINNNFAAQRLTLLSSSTIVRVQC